MDWHEVAARQGGVIGRGQLAALGLNRGQIDALVRGVRLEGHPGWSSVYRVCGADVGARGDAWAAVLGCGGAVSYQSAAARWDVPVDDDGWLHVTTVDRLRVNRRHGVRIHRVLLPPSAVTELGGLRITTRSETVFDCLGVLPLGRAMSLADRALQQRWITPEGLDARLRTQPRRWGNAQLRVILARLDPAVEAESERRFHALLRNAGIRGWCPQYEVVVDGRRWRLDVAFPDHRVVVEIDGRMAHTGHDAFVADRQRQNALTRAGWTVLRYTWDDLRTRPHAVVAELQAVLAARPQMAR